MIRKKSVISLISYDADLLPGSIKTYYPYVDEIVLGLDKDRISWSGNKFSFDEDSLWKSLKAIDHSKKIKIVESNFHRSDSPIENDTHERNYLKHYCSNDWVFSFDADEQLINPKEFFQEFCPLVERYKDLEIMFTWFLPYKQLDEGLLMIADEQRNHLFTKDIQGFVAHRDIHTYTYCRWANSSKKIKSPLAIMHYSFCRPEKELTKKVNNFGHSVESKVDPFYDIQKQVDATNYMQLRNFKTSNMGEQWPTLKLIPNENLPEILKQEAIYAY